MTRKTLEIEMSHQSCAERVQRKIKSSVCFFLREDENNQKTNRVENLWEADAMQEKQQFFFAQGIMNIKKGQQSESKSNRRASPRLSVVLLTLHADGHHAKPLIKSPAESENSFEAPPKINRKCQHRDAFRVANVNTSRRDKKYSETNCPARWR